MHVNKLPALLCIVTLVMVACSVTVNLGASPSSAPTQQDADLNQVSTMVAQTLQALTQTALLAAPASTSTPTATAAASGASMSPYLSVSAATNCYTGPNANYYGFVTTIRPGTTVTVTGRDLADNYWTIDVPGYPGSTCWLSGQYASVSGDISDLSAPATPLPSYTLRGPNYLGVWCDYSSHSGRWTHWSHDAHWSHHWDGDRGRGWYCP